MDEHRAVILPSILLALLPTLPQEGSRFAVRAADKAISVESIELVERLVATGLERLEPLFPNAGDGRFDVVLHRTTRSVPRHLVAGHHRGSPGFALLGRAEIHLLLSLMSVSAPGDLRSVVDHELVHILLHEHAGDSGPALPRWLHEGLAQELAGGAWYGVREEDLVFRVGTDSLLPFGELQRDFPRDRIELAYGQSWSFVAFLMRRYGLETLLEIVDTVDDDTDFQAAFYRTLRQSRFALEEDWHSYLLWDSGAGARSLYTHCFSLLMVLAVPLLAIAVVRRVRRERLVAERLSRDDRIQELARLQGPPWPPPSWWSGPSAPDNPADPR